MPGWAPARIRVRYADTDAMGVVYYGNYLSFFETGRVEVMRQAGAPYSELIECRVHAPVIEATVRYRQPARFDDVLDVHAWIGELGRARFTFEYIVCRESDGAVIATGRTVHAYVDATTLRPVRPPAWVLAALERLRSSGEAAGRAP
jgi:acyl-CoA thioester hydrolase